jgi:Uma2 family endonuclease
VPPLQAGQRLSRAEFERRYQAMPELKKAELIEGVVYVPSPVRHPQHGQPHFRITGWLGIYEGSTPGVEGSVEATVRLDEGNVPQPDALLFIRPDCGGQARVGPDDYITGAPELAAQVAASTAALDLGPRMEALRRNGVKEYLIWRVEDGAIDWFVLRGEQYERLPLTDGVYRSETFPGLWLDPAAMLGGDVAGVHRVLQQGLSSVEHADFVRRLQARAGGSR